jgi:ribose-phosphate pyrophosphokinase
MATKVPGTQLYLDETTTHYTPAPGQYGQIKLLAGTGGVALGTSIAEYLEIPLSGRDIIRFSNENIFVKLQESVRGQDVYLVQSLTSPLSDNILELLIILNTLKLDSAGRITVVMPYFPYGRSDKKDQPRVPITARMLADMIQVAGADRYMTIDLHAGQIQGFFSIPGDVLTAYHLISDHFVEKQLTNAAVVSTDLGFAKKGRNYAAKLGMPLVVVEKRRTGNKDKTEVMSLLGDIRGMDAIIIDDECDTGGTMVEAINCVINHGARDVYVAFTHPLLSGNAVDKLANAPIKEIVTTDTLPISAEKRAKLPNMTVLSVAPLLAEVILRAHDGRSVGELFRE